MILVLMPLMRDMPQVYLVVVVMLLRVLFSG
jgi:hypothetical protein